MMKEITSLLFSIFILFCSCHNNKYYEGTKPILEFSSDTLTFDTVFTSVGSITRYIKVKNTSKKKVLLDRIQLMHQPGHQFVININGNATSILEDIEIPAKDSIYIFAKATIDPNDVNSPFIVLDEIQYLYGSISQSSYLRAWGQDAYFHYGEIIEGDSIWHADKPHVVVSNKNFYGVGIESFGSLTIASGCNIFFSEGSAIFSDGPIVVGTPDCTDSVNMQSNRIEDLPNGFEYENVPGLWFGIIIRNNASLNMYNTSIKNSSYAIMGRWIGDSFSDFQITNQPKIVLDKVRIKYTSNNALLCLKTELSASNCLFYKNGSNVSIGMGGEYTFDNCTFYTTSEAECIQLSNFASTSSQGGYGDLAKANFTNCIIYGNKSEELSLNNEPSLDFNYSFKNCLIKTELDSLNSNFSNCILNENPEFINSSADNFSLASNSPCIESGYNNMLTEDINCNIRNSSLIDIGAFAY